MKLLCITAPHFCAGIEFTDSGTPFNSSPILRWVLRNGWGLERTIAWTKSKGYQWEVLG